MYADVGYCLPITSMKHHYLIKLELFNEFEDTQSFDWELVQFASAESA